MNTLVSKPKTTRIGVHIHVYIFRKIHRKLKSNCSMKWA